MTELFKDAVNYFESKSKVLLFFLAECVMLAFNLFAVRLYGRISVTFGVFWCTCAKEAFNVQLR